MTIPIYTAIGLQLNTYDCMYALTDKPNYDRNLKHICHMIDVAVVASIEHPARLVALSEGAIQGFPDEMQNWNTADYARTGAIDIPGPETNRLAEKAVQWDIYIIGQAKARMPEFPDRFFNTAFVIDPSGEIVLKHRKNAVFPLEHSTTPHDVYDQWVAMFGESLDAFFPVARTPIGNIAACVCFEGNFPELARGVALNGAEIIYRPSSMENKTTQGAWEIQNRARALDNACYVVAPNTGRHYIDDDNSQGFFCGGLSMIVDYRGSILHVNSCHDDCFVSAPINIEAVRQHRVVAKNFNWIPLMRTELFRLIYEKTIWPPNLTKKYKTLQREISHEILNKSMANLQAQGVFTPPSEPFQPYCRPMRRQEDAEMTQVERRVRGSGDPAGQKSAKAKRPPKLKRKLK